jgi:hypothetical protein
MTTTTMTTTTTAAAAAAPVDSEISVTPPIIQNNQFGGGNTNIYKNSPLALTMLLLGYLLGSSPWRPTATMTMTMTIPQLVDSILVPLFCGMVVIYLTARLTILKGDFLAAKPPKKKNLVSKQSAVPRRSTLGDDDVGAGALTRSDAAADDDCGPAAKVVNLTGSYQLVENQNFEELLAVQGVPWALRCAANKLRPIHRFTHVGETLTIKIEGIIETKTSYEIGGPPVECFVRGRKFLDTMEYLIGGDGVQTIKKAPEEGYSVTVCRRLSSDRKQLTMTSTVSFDDDDDNNNNNNNNNKKPVTSTQFFEWMEPESTNTE